MTDGIPAGQVLILTGPPGAGKTAIADVLAGSAQRPTVHMRTDTFYRWIRAGYVAPYLPEAAHQNEIVIAAIAEAAARYACGGYDVIVDGIVGPWFLDALLAVFRRDDIATSYVVLRPRLDVTLSRATERGADELTLAEPISQMHTQFSTLGELERYVIDSSDHSIEQTAAQVADGLTRRAYLLPDG